MSAWQTGHLNVREAAGKENFYSPFDTAVVFQLSGNKDSIVIQ